MPARRSTRWTAGAACLLAVAAGAALPATAAHADPTPTPTPTAAAAAAAAAEACVKGDVTEVLDEPWAQGRLGVSTLAAGFEGWNTRIAVIAAGVDGGHHQLENHLAKGAALGVNESPHTDCKGGGTAIAGAAAAAAVGGSALRGVAPQALIIPIRLPDWMADPATKVDEKNAPLAADLLVQAVRAALDQRAQVIVLPGVGLADTPALRQAIADAERTGAVLIEPVPPKVTPATSYPLAYPEVLGVIGHGREGGLNPTDAEVALVDLSAPGIEVLAAMPSDTYTTISDSRVAAGFVAGATALILDDGSAPTPATVRRRLIDAAVRLPGVTTVPALSAANALGPIPSQIPPAAPLGGLDPTAAIHDWSGRTSVRLSIACLLGLIAIGGLAAAYTRGRTRQWVPAETLPAEKLIKPPTSRSI